MRVKRGVVWVLSILIGTGAGFATVYRLDTSVARYAVNLNFGWLDFILNNFSFLCVAYASFVWIWLDYFLKTKMLPE